MSNIFEKTITLRKAVRNLRAAQDNLRVKRAEYNQALNDLIEMKS